jgi:single-strand DNA-binding protein
VNVCLQQKTKTIKIYCLTTKNFKTMTSLKNSVQLIGRLGNDPEISKFENGKIKVRFSLATTEVYKNANGDKVEETQWHNIVAWNGTAKIASQYLKKGKEIALEGKLTSRSWQDKNGQKHYITEIIANQILMLSKNNK